MYSIKIYAKLSTKSKFEPIFKSCQVGFVTPFDYCVVVSWMSVTRNQRSFLRSKRKTFHLTDCVNAMTPKQFIMKTEQIPKKIFFWYNFLMNGVVQVKTLLFTPSKLELVNCLLHNQRLNFLDNFFIYSTLQSESKIDSPCNFKDRF